MTTGARKEMATSRAVERVDRTSAAANPARTTMATAIQPTGTRPRGTRCPPESSQRPYRRVTTEPADATPRATGVGRRATAETPTPHKAAKAGARADT